MTAASRVDPGRRWVRLPHVAVREDGDQVYVGNEAAGVHLACSAGVKDALALLDEPTSIEALAARSGLGRDEAWAILSPLADAVLIVPEEYADALAHGPAWRPTRTIGRFVAVDRLATEGVPGAFAIVGAPTDVAAGREGRPSHGPLLVRQAFPTLLPPPPSPEDEAERVRFGLPERGVSFVQDVEFRRQYRAEDLPAILDAGDVPYETGESIERYGARLRYLVERIVRAGMRPFTIGGDHSVTRFALGAVLASRSLAAPVGVLHFDAHHDLYRGLPPSPLCHANPFAWVVRDPSLALLYQIGLRASFDQIERGSRLAAEPRLRWMSAREIQGQTPEQVFAGIPRDLPYYLSFDIDVLDPAYAPETGSLEVGGLSYYQCLELVDYAARTFELVGADVVEVGGTERRVNLAAKVAARLAAQILLGRTPATPLESYLVERGP
jgi:arginase family enzyme